MHFGTCPLLRRVKIIQQKYLLRWLKEGNLKQFHPWSTLCFLWETTPISYVNFQEKQQRSNGYDILQIPVIIHGSCKWPHIKYSLCRNYIVILHIETVSHSSNLNENLLWCDHCSIVISVLTHLPLWCCSVSTWWPAMFPLHCCRKHQCCTKSQPAAQGLHTGKAALWRWSTESLSPPPSSDSPL